MKTKSLSERIAECRQDIIDAGLEPEHDIGFQIIEELKEELEKRKAYIVANPCGQCGGIINAIKCQAWKEEADKLKAENQALQTKIKTLEDLNAISYDANARLSKENQALLAKNEELQAENKSWQEMVDSTNQTNQALIKRLQENKNDK